jgi:hypothetical protein
MKVGDWVVVTKPHPRFPVGAPLGCIRRVVDVSNCQDYPVQVSAPPPYHQWWVKGVRAATPEEATTGQLDPGVGL